MIVERCLMVRIPLLSQGAVQWFWHFAEPVLRSQ